MVHRSQISLISVCVLVAWSAVAAAQNRAADLACKATETQAECHARLKCKASEDLEDCQKRLRNDGNAGQRDDAGNRDADERGRDRESDRDDRNDRDDRDSRGRDDSDRARDDRDDGDDRGSSRRERGQRQGGGRRGRGGSTKGFQANKTFGLGLELGEPSGLNGKYFVSESGALDFGIGAIYSHYYYGDGIHLYGDYLWHPTSLVSASAFELPLYIGVGLRYWDFDFCDRNVCGYGGSAIGIRIPFGISFDFNNVPLDIFLQLVPVLDFVHGDYYDRFDDRTHFGVDLSLGLRYWFK
ncbi:MAG: hypothetical protein JWP01_3594 [Myxococcales bacterium]|nr:hypothetical protein [Myxococcales bacterium]